MRLLIHLLVLLAICVTVINIGCDGSIQPLKDQSASRKEAPAFLKAFSDFEFVGSGTVGDDKEVPSHDFIGKVIPSHLKANIQYVFHRRRHSHDNEKPFEVLQNRLKTTGVTILEAKVGPYTFVGGAEFLISFEEGDIKGTIFSSLDWQIMNTHSLYEEWFPDDYVIILKTIGTPSNR